MKSLKKVLKNERGYVEASELGILLSGVIIMMVLVLIVVGVGVYHDHKRDKSIVSIQEGVELQIVDKDIDKRIISTGKVSTVTNSYKLMVAIDENGEDIRKISVSSAEYNAIEIGSYAFFTLSLDENNNLVKIELE